MGFFRRASLLSILLLTSKALALQVTPNSPCASVCMDDPSQDASDPNTSNTYPSDIVCNDADYENTSVGRKFASCVNCLRNSTASGAGENDQSWFLCKCRRLAFSCKCSNSIFFQIIYDTVSTHAFFHSRMPQMPLLRRAVHLVHVVPSNKPLKMGTSFQATRAHIRTALRMTMLFWDHHYQAAPAVSKMFLRRHISQTVSKIKQLQTVPILISFSSSSHSPSSWLSSTTTHGNEYWY
jgi:hypothetical protein